MSYAKFDSANKDADIVLSAGNLSASSPNPATGTGPGAVASNAALQSAGNKYCEFRIDSATSGGLVNGTICLGIAKSAFNPTGVMLGSDAQLSYGYKSSAGGGGTGELEYNSGAPQTGLGPFSVGDVISMLVSGTSIEFWKNGTSVHAAYTSLDAVAYRPAVSLDDPASGANKVTANFGATAFTYTPPAGYTGWTDGATIGTASVTITAMTMSATGTSIQFWTPVTGPSNTYSPVSTPSNTWTAKTVPATTWSPA